MTAATVEAPQSVFWRPSAALRVAHQLRLARRLTATVLAAICAFTLLLTAAPHASSNIALGAETAVAAQTHPAAAVVGAERPASPAFVGGNSLYGYDFVSVSRVAPSGALRFADDAAEGFGSYSSFRRAYGSAGEGMNWHHIVEQTPGNVGRFGPEAIHNTQNIVRLDVATHRQVSGYYSSIQDFTGGQTVRSWLADQPLTTQREFGIDVLERFGAG